jgi:hypothetical protein
MVLAASIRACLAFDATSVAVIGAESTVSLAQSFSS